MNQAHPSLVRAVVDARPGRGDETRVGNDPGRRGAPAAAAFSRRARSAFASAEMACLSRASSAVLNVFATSPSLSASKSEGFSPSAATALRANAAPGWSFGGFGPSEPEPRPSSSRRVRRRRRRRRSRGRRRRRTQTRQTRRRRTRNRSRRDRARFRDRRRRCSRRARRLLLRLLRLLRLRLRPGPLPRRRPPAASALPWPRAALPRADQEVHEPHLEIALGDAGGEPHLGGAPVLGARVAGGGVPELERPDVGRGSLPAAEARDVKRDAPGRVRRGAAPQHPRRDLLRGHLRLPEHAAQVEALGRARARVPRDDHLRAAALPVPLGREVVPSHKICDPARFAGVGRGARSLRPARWCAAFAAARACAAAYARDASSASSRSVRSISDPDAAPLPPPPPPLSDPPEPPARGRRRGKRGSPPGRRARRRRENDHLRARGTRRPDRRGNTYPPASVTCASPRRPS